MFERKLLDFIRFIPRFLGRVNDKGSAYKEFLITTGIAKNLAQVI
jgi:hypothetical protein